MKINRIGLIVAVGVLLSTASLAAQKKSGSETGLLGIKLYDTGAHVVSIYGSPDSVEAVNVGSTSAAGGGNPGTGAAGSGPGGPSGPGGGPRAGSSGGSRGPASSGTSDATSPFGFGDELLKGQGQMSPAPKTKGGAGGGGTGAPGRMAPGGTPPGGYGPGGTGPGGYGGPGGPGGAPGGPGGGAQGTDANVVFTRWIYNRAGSKYGFVFDKFNRVVQIEAIGIQNGKVKTKRGIGFGSTFGQIIGKYNKNPDGSANAPDGYEISGQTLVVRYLVKNKVAFRLSRLGKDTKQVVTGIAVAAGKI